MGECEPTSKWSHFANVPLNVMFAKPGSPEQPLRLLSDGLPGYIIQSPLLDADKSLSYLVGGLEPWEFYDFPFTWEWNVIIPSEFDWPKEVARDLVHILLGALEHFFIFHNIWDVIRQPLTNSIIFQDGHIAPPTSHPKWLDLHHIHPNLVTVMAMAGSPAAELTHPSFFGMG